LGRVSAASGVAGGFDIEAGLGVTFWRDPYLVAGNMFEVAELRSFCVFVPVGSTSGPANVSNSMRKGLGSPFLIEVTKGVDVGPINLDSIPAAIFWHSQAGLGLTSFLVAPRMTSRTLETH